MQNNIYHFPKKPPSSRLPKASKKLLVWLGVAALFAALMWTRQTPTGIHLSGLKQTMPTDFADVKLLEEKAGEVSLSSFKGKVVILHFWATWCGPCVYELPLVDKLQSQFSPDEVAVIPVSLDKNLLPQDVRKFYEQHKIKHLPVYLDEYGAFKQVTSSRAVPQTFILNREGKQVAYVRGVFDWDQEKVNQLMNYHLGLTKEPEKP